MNENLDLLEINWNDLKYFLALWRYGRLSLAATKLGCTHVTIANRIEQLEKAIDTRLFYQNSKGFHLTKAGENLIPYAEKCERTLRLANENYRSGKEIRSKIRIGVTEGFSNYYLSDRLPIWVKGKDIDIETHFIGWCHFNYQW
ncbi:LysR family transcriptional regulator [Marinomonas sp. GJ51-6]|uniref:LysR family transcriptional regulator n=1 Tax=Marinomonas sp. GJ51-6 TaxID=2992802 RepID=UPI002934D2D9|nr:LysR family transcriptional regulator [Marinomonas sp. GJ51-6]WOD06786.1 LysR family transcriptional regulator [Marinomonas sp. GJ51-6]